MDITFGYLNIKVYSILEYEELINRTIKTYFRVGQQYPGVFRDREVGLSGTLGLCVPENVLRESMCGRCTLGADNHIL